MKALVAIERSAAVARSVGSKLCVCGHRGQRHLSTQSYTGVGDFEPGTRVVVAPLGEHKIGSFICYESAFPTLVRQLTRNGAEALFNLSNDGYFGRSASAREQHLLVVRMRAAENARWIVRATNDGITAAVDPAGRVVKRLPSFVETAAELPYSYRREQTFYTRHGDLFAWSCVVVGVIAIVQAMRRVV